MYLNERDLSSEWEVEALFGGREWDEEQWVMMTREGGMKREGLTREAVHCLSYHQELLVDAALKSSAWVF